MLSKQKCWVILILFISVFLRPLSYAEESKNSTTPLLNSLDQISVSVTPPTQLGPWKMKQQKTFKHHRLELMERHTLGPEPIRDAMKVRIVSLSDGSVKEVEGFNLTADLRGFVQGWTSGQILDLEGDGLENLLIREFSGGAHCCYSYHFYSLKIPLQTLGEIKLNDCGEKISLKDLNQDKKLELITCDARFAYLGGRSFAESPFPPAVYALKNNQYVRADMDFKTILQQDIQKQEAQFAQTKDSTSLLQLVADYFLLGEESKAWEKFKQNYQEKDKERISLELIKILGLSISPEKKEESYE